MPLYKFPLLERFVTLSHSLFRFTYVTVDGIGLVAEYNNEEELKPENVRGHLVGVQDKECLVQADDICSAIEKFHTEYEGAITGEKAKALEVNRTKPILELPACSRVIEDEGSYFCRVSDDDEDTPVDCILDGYHRSYREENCPIDQFMWNVHDGVGTIQRIVLVKPYGEFWVVQSDPSYVEPSKEPVRSFC